MPSEASPHKADAVATPFRSIAIVGLGLIGGSLALALRRAGFRGELRAVSSPRTIAAALRDGVVDAGGPYETLVEHAAAADLIVLASPIRRILEHLVELGRAGDRLRDGVVVTDVGSTKRAILAKAMECLPARARFIGGHPMAGSERRGLSAADPFLFQNAWYVLTPAPGVAAAERDALGALLACTGARILVLDAEHHDRTAALISHLPQLLAVALVNCLERHADNRDDAIRLAAGGFRDMTRIASSHFAMWDDIYATNAAPVRDLLDRFRDDLAELAPLVGDPALGDRFDNAAHTRAAIPKDSKGFLRPLWEVLVVVEDRPGVIAAIANALAGAGINIKDIEVVKVREDEGGTLRLAFSTVEIARQAIALLEGEGFRVRLRE